MNPGHRRLFAATLSVLAVILGSWAAVASANTDSIIAPSPVPPQGEPTENNGWQAGTCKKDSPICSVKTPSQFFEEAGAHPQVGFTQFIVEYEKDKPLPGGKTPVGALKTVHVDLPQGLSVNPQATKQCEQSQFDTESCPAASEVGYSAVTASLLGIEIAPVPGVTEVPVYNIVPPNGHPARFGLKLAGSPVYLEAEVFSESDYHEGFTIAVPELPVAGETILKNRLVFDGRSGDGTFITTPTTCFDPETEPAYAHLYSTYLLAASVAEENQAGYVFPASAEPALESPLPKGKKPIECDKVPYQPTTAADPGTSATDSPAGATVEVHVPHIVPPTPNKEGARESSQTREAALSLPQGMGLNPSAANGLQTCTDAQFGKGTKNPIACPAASKIGTVAITTPPLPASDGVLSGPVFVGQQLSRDPASGDEYRIFVDAESARYGISVRLIGRVSADATTGQLTTRFQELPQVPFSSVAIKLDGGPHATLTSPPTCGPNTSVATMTPWTGNPAATPSSQFTLSSKPGGGSCPQTLGERPFAPGFHAAASDTTAAANTNISMDLTRTDGEQELKGVDVTLPPGMTAKLAGLRYCPEAALQAAAASSGLAEETSPSCGTESLVGAASITAGSGPDPIRIDSGKAFLAGPWNGAPLSLAVITPATAGPFDLGTVVARVALFVDHRTAQVRAVTDPLPHVYGGALLDLRSISVRIDRQGFSRNGTNCAASSFAATLHGGGSNPNDPAAFSSVAASSPYQATGCAGLGFEPSFYLRAFGATRRTGNPKLRAILVAKPGDANVSRAAVTLPPSIILEQSAIGNVCTRVQFAAGNCPSNSVYGFAEATSPLLDGPLKGPVYLRSSDNTLPDLVADLHGQVDIELAGRTDTVHGRLRNTFDTVPDVPVTRFVLTIRGGKKHGLLVNSRDLCRRRQFARLDLGAQNGKGLTKKKLKLRRTCKKHKKHHHKHGHGNSAHRLIQTG